MNKECYVLFCLILCGKVSISLLVISDYSFLYMVNQMVVGRDREKGGIELESNDGN